MGATLGNHTHRLQLVKVQELTVKALGKKAGCYGSRGGDRDGDTPESIGKQVLTSDPAA